MATPRSFPYIAFAPSVYGNVGIVAGTVGLAVGPTIPRGCASLDGNLGGPTSQRPSPQDPDNIGRNAPSIGEPYFDTTIAAVVVWDGRDWRSPFTGAIA